MASSTAFINHLVAITGTTINRMNRIGAELRGAGLVEKSGRGKSAANISVEDAANILIAFLGAERAEEAVIVVKVFSHLQIIRGDIAGMAIDTTPPPKNFAEFVQMVFSDSYYSNALNSIRVSRSTPQAFAIYADGHGGHKTIEFGPEKEIPDESTHFRVEVVIDGRSIRRLLRIVNPEGVAYTFPGEWLNP